MDASSFSSGLVSFEASGPVGEPEIGGLLTVELFNGKQSGARLTRISHGSFFVTLCGLTVPEPYDIGRRLVLNRDQIIDWSPA